MLLRDLTNGEELEAVIEHLTQNDFKILKENNHGFGKFDWNIYKGHEVFKLRLKTDISILGIMSLKDHTDKLTDAIEIELLEISSQNIGQKKRLDHIGGCLIAFACRESFRCGHNGCVFLIPKISLVKHYNLKYGFHHVNLKSAERPEGLMILYDDGASNLITRYLT